MSKPSQRLRGRATSFKLDRDYVRKQLDAYDGDSQRHVADMRARMEAYRIVSDELSILADELGREGQ